MHYSFWIHFDSFSNIRLKPASLKIIVFLKPSSALPHTFDIIFATAIYPKSRLKRLDQKTCTISISDRTFFLSIYQRCYINNHQLASVQKVFKERITSKKPRGKYEQVHAKALKYLIMDFLPKHRDVSKGEPHSASCNVLTFYN